MASFNRGPLSSGIGVAKMRPWYSLCETDRKVYHDDPRCKEGVTVEARFRREGTDGRRKCEECQQHS